MHSPIIPARFRAARPCLRTIRTGSRAIRPEVRMIPISGRAIRTAARMSRNVLGMIQSCIANIRAVG